MKLTFDPATHQYQINDSPVLSVTQVLKAVGIVDPAVYRNHPGCAERGTAVHAICHYFDDGDLDMETLDPCFVGYLDAYRRFHDEMSFEPLAHEIPVGSEMYMYAGTLDLICRINGCPYLIDIKSGQQTRAAELQTAAYENALSEMGDDVMRRAALYLTSNGTYRLVEHDNPYDFNVFAASLEVARWKGKK